MANLLQDTALSVTKALPAAGAAVATDPIDLGQSCGPAAGKADFVEDIDFLLTVPAVPNLADGKKITYDVQVAVDSAFTSPIEVYAALVVSTGAGGAGAAAVSQRFTLPTSVNQRYLRVNATVDAAGGDNTAKSMTVKALF